MAARVERESFAQARESFAQVMLGCFAGLPKLLCRKEKLLPEEHTGGSYSNRFSYPL
jgi:hypothetical protein